MNLTPAQSTIARDTHRFRVLNCGRRFGKSTLACEEMIGVAVAKKERRVAYYAPTRDDAREIMWSMLIKRCEPIIEYRNDSRLELRVFTQDRGVSTIVLYGWEAVKDRGKGRGLSNDFIVLDEVSSMPGFWEGWNEVLSPTLIDQKGSALFISTPKGFNHFYDLYNRESTDPDFKSFHYTSHDNPNIPKSEIDRERLAKPEDTFAQEYLADFRKQEGLVYKEFSREQHLFDDHTQYSVADTILGVDFGFTNPASVLTIHRDKDSRFFVRYEWYKREQTEPQIAEYVKSIGAQYVYPDPESPSGIKELTDRGVNVREVVKNKDSIRNGISKVRELFLQNRLFIHKDCVNLIWELETYKYPEPKEGKNEDENPVKENDHAVDALRYALMMHTHSQPDPIQENFNLYAHTYE